MKIIKIAVLRKSRKIKIYTEDKNRIEFLQFGKIAYSGSRIPEWLHKTNPLYLQIKKYLDSSDYFINKTDVPALCEIKGIESILSQYVGKSF